MINSHGFDHDDLVIEDACVASFDNNQASEDCALRRFGDGWGYGEYSDNPLEGVFGSQGNGTLMRCDDTFQTGEYAWSIETILHHDDGRKLTIHTQLGD